VVYVLRAVSAGGSCRRAGLAVSSLAAEPPARPCRRLGGGPCRWAGLADGRVLLPQAWRQSRRRDRVVASVVGLVGRWVERGRGPCRRGRVGLAGVGRA
jgi:hypothetical protein